MPWIMFYQSIPSIHCQNINLIAEVDLENVQPVTLQPVIESIIISALYKKKKSKKKSVNDERVNG